MSGDGWELVTDCETAGVLPEAVDLPVRAHPWVPVGQVFAFNRGTRDLEFEKWPDPLPEIHKRLHHPDAIPADQP